ncbi:MAG: MBG domain-containing protein, partial [Telluria sp.]
TGSFSSPVGYAINALPGTLNINRAALLIAVDDKNKVYGDADPLLTATFSGLVAEDSAAVVTGLTLAAPTGAAATAGTHAIFGSNAVAENYDISYQPGTLTVFKAPLAVLPGDQAKVYGDTDPVLTAGFSGLKYGDSGAVVSGLTLATATGAAATAGTHPIIASGGTAANYTLSYQTGTLRVARAPLLVAADNKSKVYGAPDPVLTATMSGFRYSDTAAAVTGLVLSAPTGAAASAGSHPIVAQGGAAANYALSYQPGVLAVDQAVLTYVADPIRQLQGAPQAIPGSVTGFVYDDTLASATSGTLQFVALSPTPAPPGVYAVEGRGLTAANYRFVQAPSNATALTTLPLAIEDRPTIAKDITFESSNVYEKNFGSPRLCVGLGPLGSGSGASEGNDPLALEWSRVRVSPNLSNCLGLGQRNGCQDF